MEYLNKSRHTTPKKVEKNEKNIKAIMHLQKSGFFF